MRLTTKIHRENGRQFSIIRLIDVKYSIILDMKKCDMLTRFERYSDHIIPFRYDLVISVQLRFLLLCFACGINLINQVNTLLVMTDKYDKSLQCPTCP